MAKIVPNPEFIEAAADALDSLDFSNRGVEVRAWAGAGPPEAVSDPEKLAQRCLLAAVQSDRADAELLRDSDPVEDPDAEDRVTSWDDDDALPTKKKYRWD